MAIDNERQCQVTSFGSSSHRIFRACIFVICEPENSFKLSMTYLKKLVVYTCRYCASGNAIQYTIQSIVISIFRFICAMSMSCVRVFAPSQPAWSRDDAHGRDR
jgi:hypothetical protein